MDKSEFWRLIEEAKREGGGECDGQVAALQALLSRLPSKEIVSFDQVFNGFRDSAYRWDLWGVAYLINGGASEDGFEYFLRWLIGQGEAMFEGALAAPDSLADLLNDDVDWGDACLDCEELGYAAMEAYEEKTKQELVLTRPVRGQSEPSGKRWEEDELDGLFPKIFAKIEGRRAGTSL